MKEQESRSLGPRQLLDLWPSVAHLGFWISQGTEYSYIVRVSRHPCSINIGYARKTGKTSWPGGLFTLPGPSSEHLLCILIAPCSLRLVCVVLSLAAINLS
jgi:hypothetical protein